MRQCANLRTDNLKTGLRKKFAHAVKYFYSLTMA